ncbi:hypothetical protein [Bradyrhizobium sp. CCBAU 51627]|uniref:hypothetical protein n=1 Tax=Bradyrhizobium sp. CCBAU 51627 TaxID=1325088 RepID=UPI0023062B42|nr:hypothetical protein [Bradyrhizobium sp. CCBAU 51627]MDA9435563.1 hypothetical protein [Bradyrhizobium sp. CCBAU 51627]
MSHEIRELSIDDLDDVSGGNKIVEIAINVVANLVYDGLKWLVNNGTIQGGQASCGMGHLPC